ncbi:MAG: hypothetical protein KDA22_14725, partial [Phycisphaerales bacterium]|nr:hypothetical protein [Phycisphaerales bacterium]
FLANVPGQSITFTTNASLANNGTVAADGSTLVVQSTSWTTPGTLELGAGGVVSCGVLPLEASSVVSTELAGTSTSTYGRIVCSGNATFDGTIAVQLGGGFTPAVGNTFDVVAYGTHTGKFSTYEGLDLGAVTLAPNYLPTVFQLEATSALAAR